MMTAQHTIGIIVFDEVLTSEVIAPAEVFGIAAEHDWFSDWRVVMIGVEDKPSIVSAEGITIGVDCTIHDDIVPDVLIVPGAYDMDGLLSNEKLNTFIQKVEASAQWIASNCSGAFLLGNSGVLNGKQATTWFGGEASLKEQFPQIDVKFDDPVVVDNRRVTSNGGLVSYPAALVLLGKLSSVERAQEVYDTLSLGRVDSWTAIEEAISA